MLPPVGVTIRSGRADESAALAALIPGAGHEPYVSLPRLTACQAEGLLWTAVDGVDRPVGFLAATIADDALHIVALAVARAHQRRGVGRALLERAIDHGRWAFFPAVTLTADAGAPFDVPFYRRLGFVALRPEGLRPDLAAFLRVARDAGGSEAERVAMAKVL